MIKNIDLYQLTQLAEASYADLWNPLVKKPYTASQGDAYGDVGKLCKLSV